MDFALCRQIRNCKIICVEENTRKFGINNTSKKNVGVVKVDGCLVTDDSVPRCDYLFEVGSPTSLLIYLELKGCNVEHAFKQLASTMDICNSEYSGIDKVCYIVASRIPKIGPKIQRLKIMLSKSHKVMVHLKTRKFIYNAV